MNEEGITIPLLALFQGKQRKTAASNRAVRDKPKSGPAFSSVGKGECCKTGSCQACRNMLSQEAVRSGMDF